MLDVFEKHKYDPSIVTKSRTWFRQQATLLRKEGIRPQRMYQYSGQYTTTVKPGNLYMFFYDPKTKEDLPYWDKFPMVLVLENYSDGFLGLNLHYLPPKFRVAFLTKLMKLNEFCEPVA